MSPGRRRIWYIAGLATYSIRGQAGSVTYLVRCWTSYAFDMLPGRTGNIFGILCKHFSKKGWLLHLLLPLSCCCICESLFFPPQRKGWSQSPHRPYKRTVYRSEDYLRARRRRRGRGRARAHSGLVRGRPRGGGIIAVRVRGGVDGVLLRRRDAGG